jgi:ATP-binding cassette subfamily B protein
MAQDKQIHTLRTLRFFWDHATRYPAMVWALGLLVPALVVSSDFVMPYILAQVLATISTGNYDHQNVWASFGPQLVAYSAFALISGVIGWRVAIWLAVHLEVNVARDLSRRVFSHLMAMSASFHANRFAGSLVSQTNKLIGAYMRLADATMFNLAPLIVSIIATVVILAPRAPRYVAILLIISVAYLAGTIYFSGAVSAASAAEAAAQNRQTGYLADSLSNVSAIKTFAAISSEEARYGLANDEVREAGLRTVSALIKRQNYASFLSQSLRITALIIAIIGVGVFKADIATIFLMVTYTGTLSSNLWQFQSVLRQYNRALGDSHDMIEILQIKPGIKDPIDSEPSRMTAGDIVFKDMTFTHGENDDPLFSQLNLHIRPGEKIGLVGRSGSGKTTLTRLLLRFADLDSGHIAIDGQNITRVTQDDLRRAISYVPQEPLLFHRTLRENIAYGKPDATEEEIQRAAQRAHAHDFIEKLPHGYDTLVGERGIKLSGGQRQRVAIARAMLKDAPILALDEATSALDSESERLIQSALWSLMEGRTAIVIAHRLSTIARMDRIVVLEDGTIIEDGTHAQLLAAGGQYASLWSHQSGDFIEENGS